MLPAIRIPDGQSPDQVESKKREDEITKVRPTATSLLLALMDAEQEAPPPPKDEEEVIPPPLHSEIRALGRGIGEARASGMREMLPSEGSLDRWFEAMCAPQSEEPANEEALPETQPEFPAAEPAPSEAAEAAEPRAAKGTWVKPIDAPVVAPVAREKNPFVIGAIVLGAALLSASFLWPLFE